MLTRFTRRRNKDATEATRVHDAAKAVKPRSRIWKFLKKAAPADRAAAIPALLAPYGYEAQSDVAWDTGADPLRGPQLNVKVSCHAEVGKHTHYRLDCTLTRNGEQTSRLHWTAERRLKQLRMGLHNAVKKELGSSYDTHFKGARFAHHGGVNGTTARLDAWCFRFAACANARQITPLMVAQALKLLGAPAHGGHKSFPSVDYKVSSSDAGASTAASASELGEEDFLSECESYESDFESDSEVSDTGSEWSEDADSEPETHDDSEISPNAEPQQERQEADDKIDEVDVDDVKVVHHQDSLDMLLLSGAVR